MGTLYIDTGGSALNSGSTDNNTATLSGTGDATVAGSVVTLTAGTDLTNVDATAGSATQSTICIQQATNTNQKIFWITAKAGSGGATPNVTVSVAPTGVTASDWKIGGRHVWTDATIRNAPRAGDTVQFNNSPASAAADLLTVSNSGDTTSGYIKYIGKTGVRPVLTVTNTNQVLELSGAALWFENLELVQQGASGNVVAGTSGCTVLVLKNIKISDGGGDGINTANGQVRIVGCEVTGVLGSGISTGASTSHRVIGCYLHDNGSSGVSNGSVNDFSIYLNNILDSNGGQGIYLWGNNTVFTNQTYVIGNTFYGNGNSGLQFDDLEIIPYIVNNIFSENGNAAGEYNVEFVVAGINNLAIHEYNVLHHSGGGGAGNLSNLTAGSTESTSDPLFTNAAAGDFSISNSSPAKSAGFPTQYLGGNANYLDIGAVQRIPLTSAETSSVSVG